MDYIWLFFNLLGGLALFLFGLKTLGDSLQEMAGRKAQQVLEFLTSKPIIGMLLGTVVTMAVQSSSLVTVMVVTLVNSTMLNLKQAASVIMGANIGTTLTAQLVAFSITDWWVIFSAVGFAMFFIIKRNDVKTIGYALFGFAMLLLGMSLMSDAMRPLRGMPAFLNMIAELSDNAILSLLVGTLFTALIQSSSATTGIIIAMSREGLIPVEAALPIILGANIGTCITAVFAGLGGSVSAKRAAAIHVVFNTVGALIFMVLLRQFQWLVLLVSPDDIPRQIANAHTIFAILSTAMFMPFINVLVKIVTRLIPERETAEDTEKVTQFIDKKMIDNPGVAITLAQNELLHMAELAAQNVSLSVEGFISKKKSILKRMKRQEKTVDKLEKEIVGYLAAVSQSGMGRGMSIHHAGLLHAANDIERVSDHAQNIARLARKVIDEKIEFPRQAIKEIEDILEPVKEILDTAIKSVRDNDATLVPKVKELEKIIDEKEKQMRSAHIKRISEGEISAEGGIIYLDVLSNFERIGDHAMNISHLPQGRL